MNLKLASYFAILLSGTLAGLTGCLSDGGEETISPNAHVEAFGSYTLSGDTLFMYPTPDTVTWCDGDHLVTEIPDSVTTYLFKIEGNIATLSLPYREYVDLNGLETDSTGIFFQRYLALTRISGQSGLEGSWKYTEFGYRVTQGTLTTEVKKFLDKKMEREKDIMRFGATGLTFTGGKTTLYEDIRWADKFLAVWNGKVHDEMKFDDDDKSTPDSARYDAKVAVVNRDTVKIMGNRTGETVTIGFAKDGTKSYISDKAGRKAYSDVKNPASCLTEQWYHDDFLPKNAKQDILLKRGPVRGNKRGHPGILPW